MWQLIVKAGISGILIAAASEVARRNALIGGIIIALPLTSILAMIWLWNDSGDGNRVAAFATSTFWFVLPTLPMFLVLPLLLKQGVGFWLALAAVSAMTVVLYLFMMWLLPRFGVNI